MSVYSQAAPSARAPFVLGALGLGSGLVSGLIPFSPAWIPAQFHGFQIHETVAPLHTPFVFAAVIGYGLHRWGLRHQRPLAHLVPALWVIAGWLLAINITLKVGDWVENLFKQAGVDVLSTAARMTEFVLAGSAGGLVGAAITMIGCMLLAPQLRGLKPLLSVAL